MKPVPSDSELKRRRKVQGQIGRTTSTLGLTSVGLLGASVAARKKPGLVKLNPEKLKNASFGTSITAGGIGGVGGFNQAAIYSAESRKKKPVVKRDEMAPTYGEVAKAWTPTPGPGFNSEKNRHKRAAVAETATATAGAGAASVGAFKGLQGVGQQGRGLDEKNPVKAKALRTAGKAKVRTGGKLIAAGAAGLVASDVIHHKRRSQGFQTYSKSAPFGVTH